MIDLKSAALAAVFLGLVSTLGDLVWALWIPRHRPIYGLVHGAIVCLCIGVAIGVRGRRVTVGAGVGPMIGLIAAAGFYALVGIAGFAAMFPMWMLFWVLFGILEGRLRGDRTAGGAVARGLAAAVLSGAAFYAISGIWFSRRPGGPNYAYNFAAWTFAFFPGFLSLFAGGRPRAALGSSSSRSSAALLVAIAISISVSAVRTVEQRPVSPARGAPPAPAPFDIIEKSIPELQTAMQAGTVTARALVEIYLARIEAYDQKGPRIDAFITLNPHALDEAAALDRERASHGPRGPLHGIPVVIKDNFDMAGLPTTAGSLALAALVPPDDAFQVRRLREAGAVILGKTNMHELASGITTISSLGGQTRNPYDLARNPGGSSGGTGAAVAANFAAAGMGTDTCGSIRIPSSHNALIGLRPTLGLSSRDGIVPLSHTQDVAGPIARNVVDVAILLDATVGVDPADDTTKLGDGRAPRSYRDALSAGSLKGARVGVLRSLFGDAAEDTEAGEIVRRALNEMKTLGAETIDVAIPKLDELLRGSSVIDAEFKFDLQAYLAAMPTAPVHSLGDILDRGMYHSALESSMRRRNAVESQDTEQYRRARARREPIKRLVIAALDEHRLDAVAYPTMRRKPALVGDPQAGTTCQLSASSGLPALSMPAGFTADGLPIGIELLGREFDEPRLLSLAFAFEQAMHVRRPPFSTPALEGRAAPAPIAFVSIAGGPARAKLTVRLTFDPLTGRLSYQAATTDVRPEDVLGAWIQRGSAGETGPALFQLIPRGQGRADGVVELRSAQRSALREGKFYVALYVKGQAAPGRAQLELPQRRP